MKRYCKATLNLYSNKKIDNNKIFFIYMIDFLSQNRNFTTEYVKTVKISVFFSDFCSKFQVFPGFQVKLQTCNLLNNHNTYQVI